VAMRYFIGLAVLVGFSGLFGSSEFLRTSVSDRYPSLFPATFQPFGGYYVIHFGAARSFDGQPPEQVVVIRFDNMRHLLAWHSSEAFKALYDVHKIGNVRAFAVEGISNAFAPPNS
jgi:uncharacterized protein (DUF1330 family)